MSMPFVCASKPAEPTRLDLDHDLLLDLRTRQVRFTRTGQAALAKRFARRGIALQPLHEHWAMWKPPLRMSPVLNTEISPKRRRRVRSRMPSTICISSSMALRVDRSYRWNSGDSAWIGPYRNFSNCAALL